MTLPPALASVLCAYALRTRLHQGSLAKTALGNVYKSEKGLVKYIGATTLARNDRGVFFYLLNEVLKLNI
jgi:hypothetical protein